VPDNEKIIKGHAHETTILEVQHSTTRSRMKKIFHRKMRGQKVVGWAESRLRGEGRVEKGRHRHLTKNIKKTASRSSVARRHDIGARRSDGGEARLVGKGNFGLRENISIGRFPEKLKRPIFGTGRAKGRGRIMAFHCRVRALSISGTCENNCRIGRP